MIKEKSEIYDFCISKEEVYEKLNKNTKNPFKHVLIEYKDIIENPIEGLTIHVSKENPN